MFFLLTIWLLLLLVSISLVDALYGIIPDRLNAVLFGSGMVLAATRGTDDFAMAGLAACGVGALFLVLRRGFFLFRRRQGLGLGDVKFVAASAAWISWDLIPWLMLIACGLALLFAALRSWSGSGDLSERLVFGPYLAVGLAVVWIAENFR